MGKVHSAAGVFQFTQFLQGGDALARKARKGPLSFYQVGLLVHDLLVVMAAFGLSLSLSAPHSILFYDSLQFIPVAIMGGLGVSFFSTYHLYSYHFIFLRRQHLTNIVKAFCWSALSIGIVFGLYTHPTLLQYRYAMLLLGLVAVVFLVLNRFFWEYPLYLLKAVGISFLGLGIMGFVLPEQRPVIVEQWQIIPTGFMLSVCIILMTRSFLVHVVFNGWMRRRFRKQVAIVGSNEASQNLTRHVIEQNAPFWVVGFVGGREDEKIGTPVSKARLGQLRALPSIVTEKDIDEIIVTDEHIDKHVLISLLDYCTSKGITVWFSPKLMPIIDLKLYIDSFCGISMIRLCSQKSSNLFNKIKYGLDALIVLPALALLLPLFGIIAAAIKVTSPGPVFYRATAIGKNGSPFKMYKFRSMRTDTDDEIHKEYVTKLISGEITEKSGEGGVFKITDDQRVTSVGKWLRKLSLDELPQLINVLKGDMSLVGPRPCLPYEYEAYKDWHKKRLAIRPGITGVWQVAGRSAVAFEDMVLLDLYYIYNRNIMLDMNIMYETVFTVLGKEGAY
mgnify:FL=1